VSVRFCWEGPYVGTEEWKLTHFPRIHLEYDDALDYEGKRQLPPAGQPLEPGFDRARLERTVDQRLYAQSWLCANKGPL
jgi:hypothetical protein